jgi:hypothetical protein
MTRKQYRLARITTILVMIMIIKAITTPNIYTEH